MTKGLVKEKDNYWKSILLGIYVLFLIIKMTGNIIPINLYFISTIVLGLALIYFLITPKNLNKYLNKKLVPFWLFFLYGAFTLVWTNGADYGKEKLFILLSIVIISYLLNLIIINQIPLFTKLFIIATAVILIWFFYINKGFQTFNFAHRLYLNQELNPIVISRFFCFSFITGVFFLKFYSLKKYYRLLTYVLMGLTLFVAFLTGSKGPMLALLLSFLLSYVIRKRFNFASKIPFVSLMILGGLILYLISPIDGFSTNISGFIDRRYFGVEAYDSVTGRIKYIDFSFDRILNQPIYKTIFGNGIGDFGFAYSGRDTSVYPHNIFMEILYELGLMGLLMFLIMIFKVIKLNFNIGKYFRSGNRESKTLDYFFTLFYFFLIGALASGDIAGNFFVFLALIFIFQAHKIFKVDSTKEIIKLHHVSKI